MSFLTWIIVGLVAGVLASLVMGGTGYGLIGDIIIGIVGAFVGGWIFASLGVSSPWGGLPGTIFIAFIGAVVLLFLLRLWVGTRNGSEKQEQNCRAKDSNWFHDVSFSIAACSYAIALGCAK